jgi:hypothetical protein
MFALRKLPTPASLAHYPPFQKGGEGGFSVRRSGQGAGRPLPGAAFQAGISCPAILWRSSRTSVRALFFRRT